MLDDLKMIHEHDPQDALGSAEKQAEQLIYEFKLKGETQFRNINNVVYSALGGSAWPALLVHSWSNLQRPLEVVRDYDIPAYVGDSTLFVAASYSGNTEETLNALAQAEEKHAQIAVITSGGKLQQIAEEKGYVLALLPKIALPRFGVFYSFRALLQILEKAAILQENFRPQLAEAARRLNEITAAYKPDVPATKNQAKQIAQELMGKSIVVYSGPKLYPAAYKWKIDFNENAKQVAWANQYPEFSHNEFTGWSKQPTNKPYAVIELRSSLEHSQIQKRFEVTERLLSGMRPAPLVVSAKGKTVLEQLLCMAVLGDFVSLYLALLNGLNPVPLELVDKLKVALTA